ncbi:hypothetical protein, partial [Streptomyces sp. WAC01526]|uniref:hypothetical protein n=1 Tax=Streptomyces sp. WAC01526 TaxID=2588709 RepID=UPI001CA38274
LRGSGGYFGVEVMAGQGTASSTEYRWPAITSTPKYPPLPRNRATSADQSPSGNGTATTNKIY